jgi:hypothetical protein
MQTSRSARPEPGEHLPYFARYIDLVDQGDVIDNLERQMTTTLATLKGTSESAANTRHPPYTWSIKEVVGHLIDSERVFAYRALCFARDDQTPLPGFDEQAYVRQAGFGRLTLRQLLDEFDQSRRAHVSMFRNLSDEAWLRIGTANGNKMSVRALAFIIAGHELHHTAILRKRLGIDH